MLASQPMLIAEDDQMVRFMLVAFLHRCCANMHILEAADGQRAYTLYHQYGAQVITTNNPIPQMTGVEFVHVLRADSVLTPILLLSNDNFVHHAGLLDDRTLFLRKPVGIKQFTSTVLHLLDQSV